MKLKPHKTSQVVAPALAFTAVMGASIPAQAVSFNITYAPGVTYEQVVGFEMAAAIWSQYLTDNATINLHVEMTNQGLSSSDLGGAAPAIANQSYAAFISKYEINEIKKSTYDNTFLNRLKLIPDSYDFVINNIKSTGNTTLDITRANAKAVGINTSASYGGLDGYIKIDPTKTWNYDYLRLSKIGSNQYDFLSIAIHEIGHAIGFASNIDNTTSKRPASVLDLARMNNGNAIDLSVGGTPVLSVDGKNCLTINKVCAQFANVVDGEQASHWRDSTTVLGIMTPNLNPGTRLNISALDLAAFDIIGYDVNYSASINLLTLQQNATQKALSIINDPIFIRDRSADVQKMMADSAVYGWGWGGYWQGDNSDSTNTAPIFGSTLGILGLAWLGIRSLFKTRSRN